MIPNLGDEEHEDASFITSGHAYKYGDNDEEILVPKKHVNCTAGQKPKESESRLWKNN